MTQSFTESGAMVFFVLGLITRSLTDLFNTKDYRVANLRTYVSVVTLLPRLSELSSPDPLSRNVPHTQMAGQVIDHLGRAEILVLQQNLWFLGLSIQSLPLPCAVNPFTVPYAFAHDWVLERRAVRHEQNECSLRDPCTISESLV